ncbi:UpxY family transcription antiterminator [Flavobacterium johnsoniae]|uniref:Transcription antitermination protein nusG n=1 Tax=Flavobacterium johnsoniae (strain ATCC 17061 / DSM 2064 / JCM 8514 / BCRC 14874 / CCUG 350202 / NBRC 14942 / NCIMB 11054 / UW101) TaxID=376686 RepID=A5FN19_FLAJ1|nr:UpxY family transcription antiterminator [Flavobacterium johnsoniae]ABQ03393.1 transcription antitermination protein nusG [Flavobacterium johnsoniae UW101]OXG01192.1 antitermination protein NusG [Flavobacterium johnsoniae UW101]WQG79742.1 UpxY family transcription antiterminator [Flavobacterium johnsoniae UW101]SHL76548.1 Transcription antitermination factor NusG [Flavobacterium johnsoniae]
MNWYVVYTKPKWEKKVAEKLTQIGIECYCPLITQVKQWSDRKKKVEMPLFNSYVFIQIEDADRNSVFEVAGIVRYLFWLGKPAVVRDEEINVIKNSLKASNIADISVSQIQVGDKIKLETGAFSNQNAIVQEVSKTHYILVLESLGCVLKIKYK